MRKYFIFMLVAGFMVLTTGCNKETPKDTPKALTCSKVETSEDGYKTTDTIKVNSKDNKVTKVEETTITEMNPEMVEMTVSLGESFISTFNDINGFNASYVKESENSVKYTLSIDYEKLNIDELKEKFGEDFDNNSFYTSKDITVEEFKTQNLEGYTCE